MYVYASIIKKKLRLYSKKKIEQQIKNKFIHPGYKHFFLSMLYFNFFVLLADCVQFMSIIPWLIFWCFVFVFERIKYIASPACRHDEANESERARTFSGKNMRGK